MAISLDALVIKPRLISRTREDQCHPCLYPSNAKRNVSPGKKNGHEWVENTAVLFHPCIGIAWCLATLWFCLSNCDALDIYNSSLDEDLYAWMFTWHCLWWPVGSLSCYALAVESVIHRVSQPPDPSTQWSLICTGNVPWTLSTFSGKYPNDGVLEKSLDTNIETWGIYQAIAFKREPQRLAFSIPFGHLHPIFLSLGLSLGSAFNSNAFLTASQEAADAKSST